jgi:hypothetical protein
MGFPRTNDDGMRLYRDKENAYLLVFTEGRLKWQMDAIANVYPGPDPSLCYTGLSSAWFARVWPKRVEWSDMPPEWQAAFMAYMEDDDEPPFRPETIRGFWRMGGMPRAPEHVPPDWRPDHTTAEDYHTA